MGGWYGQMGGQAACASARMHTLAHSCNRQRVGVDEGAWH